MKIIKPVFKMLPLVRRLSGVVHDALVAYRYSLLTLSNLKQISYTERPRLVSDQRGK